LPSPVPKIYVRVKPTELVASLRIKILEREREHLQQMFDRGIIGKNSYYLLVASINNLYDSEGALPLTKRTEFFNTFHQTWWFRFTQKFGGRHIKKLYRSKIMQWYDSARGLLVIQLASKGVLAKYIETSLIANNEKERLQLVSQEIESNIEWAQNKMEELKKIYPNEYNYALTEKSVRMLLAHESEILNYFVRQGLVTQDDMNGIVEGFKERGG